MALDEPKFAEEDYQESEDLQGSKRDDAPDYYKRPKYRRNIIPFDTQDLSVKVIGDRFCIPNQVTEKSPAEKAGLKLGDSIVKINGADASKMGLSEAQKTIKDAGEDLQLSITKFDEEENSAKLNETHEINFGGNKDKETDATNNTPEVTNTPHEQPKSWIDSNRKIPGREHWIQPPERKVWHPIVWQQPPPAVDPAHFGREGPHRRIVSNIRRLLKDCENDPMARKKHIDHIMLSLPTGSKDPRGQRRVPVQSFEDSDED